MKPYAGETLEKTLGLLDKALSVEAPKDVSAQVKQRLASGAPQDLAELSPYLKTQSEQLIEEAKAKLRARGDADGADMLAILEAQRVRIRKTQAKKEKDADQLPLFAESERKQIESDTRYWHKRLEELGKELETEPARIRQSYDVKATRFEPVGLVYLWPVTG